MPLPKHINENIGFITILPIKDADGLNLVNQGKL